MRMLPVVLMAALLSGCAPAPAPPPANDSPKAPALPEIPVAADQPINEREKLTDVAAVDLDEIAQRGFVRILVAPSRTYFETAAGHHHGRAVDIGVDLSRSLSAKYSREIAPVFIETREDQLVPALLAAKGDVAANVLLTFVRDDQVAFAPPIVDNIRELVVTAPGHPLVSLEDVGGRTIHVRKNSDHHASLVRLNGQLEKINRPPARIVADETVKTDEELLRRVDEGRIPATIVDAYIFDLWKKQFTKTVTNNDVSVSTGGSLSWVNRKDAPKLSAFMKEYFSSRHLGF